MPKPKKFKYPIGESVKFRFYDGSVHHGNIVSHKYRNEDVTYLPTEYNQPMYTCHVPDRSGNYSRGYMVYTVTENMVKTVLDSHITIMPLKDYPTSDGSTTPIEIDSAIKEFLSDDDLSAAIDKQRQFLNR